MPIDRARRSIKFVVERLRSNADQQRDLLYPGDHPGPNRWLALIYGLLDTADLYLERSNQSDVAADDRLPLIQDAAKLAELGYDMLTEFRGSDTGEIAFPLVTPLQRWFDQLQIQNTTFFRANLEANYELYPRGKIRFEGVRDPAPSLRTAIGNVEWPFLRVTVPAKAFGVIPHLAIVAHEIGHAVFNKLNIDPTLANALFNAITRRLKEEYSTLDQNRLSEAAKDVFADWIEELAADAVMFFLTGPAGYFALCDCAQLTDARDDFSSTHPPSEIRRQILFSRLSIDGEESFATVFRLHTGQDLVENINSPLIATTRVPAEIRKKVARRPDPKEHHPEVISVMVVGILDAQDLIYEAVESYLLKIAPDCIYTPQRFHQDLSVHLKPLLSAVPPVETGTDLNDVEAVEFATILNVGWVTLLTQLGALRIKTRTSDPFLCEKMECLHGLLLKAVELSEARRTWGSIGAEATA